MELVVLLAAQVMLLIGMMVDAEKTLVAPHVILRPVVAAQIMGKYILLQDTNDVVKAC